MHIFEKNNSSSNEDFSVRLDLEVHAAALYLLFSRMYSMFIKVKKKTYKT